MLPRIPPAILLWRESAVDVAHIKHDRCCVTCVSMYSYAYRHFAVAAVWRQIKAVYEDLHQRRDALLSANAGLTPAANGAPAPEAADSERGQALRRSCSSFKCEPSLDSGTGAPLCATTSDAVVHVIPLCQSHTFFFFTASLVSCLSVTNGSAEVGLRRRVSRVG